MNSMATLFPDMTLIPVVVIERVEDAVPLAEALLSGGINCIEITLRSEAGLPAIRAIANALPQMLVGAGTVLNAPMMQRAADAGAAFQVSPGITASLCQAAAHHGIHWLPGTASASEVMLAMEYGIDHVKFFPAAQAGGVAMLQQFGSVFRNVKFCPTGGISRTNMTEYAALHNVFAIGGSWLAATPLIGQQKWSAVTQIAQESLAAL